MIPVVVDANVILAGIGWGGRARLCLKLAAGAHYIITYDEDLLRLKKPFGIAIIRPAELLRRVA